MKKLTLGVLVFLLAGAEAWACVTIGLQPGDRVENVPVYSGNRRFAAVVRQFDVPDFRSAEYSGDVDVFSVDSRPLVTALYDMSGPRPRRIGELALDRSVRDTRVLVADSGRYVVTVRFFGGISSNCESPATEATDPVIAIYARGGRIASITLADLLTPEDVERLSFASERARARFVLRQESDGREVVVVTIPIGRPGSPEKERRIDLATGAMLDEKRPLYTEPRVFVTESGTKHRDYPSPAADCAGGWALDEAVRVDSTRLLAEAVHRPLPSFPRVAKLARIRGLVYAEILVSETGDVLCARTTHLPFGLAPASQEAVRQWKFRPFVQDGRAVKAIGEVLFHFEDLDDETWQALQRGQ
ncbi:MAG TPA: energy transducer TonB [Thermoanaerobaculia bacterium]|jgi:hypothetical protein